jgi:hypothetical protein
MRTRDFAASGGGRLEPTYRALIESVRNSPIVAPDETGWRAEQALRPAVVNRKLGGNRSS